MVPEKIGKYEVTEQIGVGGFGAVYRGRDPFIKRTVAIKTCQLNDEEIKSRFFREAELAGNLHHRNITTIYDFGVENGIPYIVQEFLTGEDLDKVIKRGENVPVPRKIEILMAITDGLGYAHRESIIHRDIKPANIRILEDGAVKIMDFGIAKSLETESNLTQTGITLGTSAYLAPEQIRGEALDQRTDIFALGVLAYELVTYRKPFRGEHLSTVLYRILNEAPEPVISVAPDVPEALSRVVMRAIEKSMEARYSSMENMRMDLVAVYRQLVGTSMRFATAPRLTDETHGSFLTGSMDSEVTQRTPSQGMPTTANITPPSGALARVPAREDLTPTAVSMRRAAPAGLELVNFRDPSQRATDGRAPEVSKAPRPARPRRTLLFGAVVSLVALAVMVVIFRTRSRTAPPASPADSRPPVTAPIVFPAPQIGQDPAGPAAQPTAAPVPAPLAQALPTPPPARRFKVQFSSLPMATLFVDGRRIGSSIPARWIELSEGDHTVRFEHPDFPVYEKSIRVGPSGSPPVNYRFPMGFLVIDAPTWAGANVLIDSKFKGVLVGQKSFPLKSGAHKVTLMREGFVTYTGDVTVPEGENRVWTPPPPASRSEGTQ